MAAARERGAAVDRPRKMTDEQIAHASREVELGRETVTHMARLFNVAPLTLSRALRRDTHLA